MDGRTERHIDVRRQRSNQPMKLAVACGARSLSAAFCGQEYSEDRVPGCRCATCTSVE